MGVAGVAGLALCEPVLETCFRAMRFVYDGIGSRYFEQVPKACVANQRLCVLLLGGAISTKNAQVRLVVPEGCATPPIPPSSDFLRLFSRATLVIIFWCFIRAFPSWWKGTRRSWGMLLGRRAFWSRSPRQASCPLTRVEASRPKERRNGKSAIIRPTSSKAATHSVTNQRRERRRHQQMLNISRIDCVLFQGGHFLVADTTPLGLKGLECAKLLLKNVKVSRHTPSSLLDSINESVKCFYRTRPFDRST